MRGKTPTNLKLGGMRESVPPRNVTPAAKIMFNACIPSEAIQQQPTSSSVRTSTCVNYMCPSSPHTFLRLTIGMPYARQAVCPSYFGCGILYFFSVEINTTPIRRLHDSHDSFRSSTPKPEDTRSFRSQPRRPPPSHPPLSTHPFRFDDSIMYWGRGRAGLGHRHPSPMSSKNSTVRLLTKPTNRDAPAPILDFISKLWYPKMRCRRTSQSAVGLVCSRYFQHLSWRCKRPPSLQPCSQHSSRPCLSYL